MGVLSLNEIGIRKAIPSKTRRFILKTSVSLEVCWGIRKITRLKYDSCSISDLLRHIVEFSAYKSREGDKKKRERIDFATAG